jgi:formylglycine-generating enzyme required for sulfatase activity
MRSSFTQLLAVAAIALLGVTQVQAQQQYPAPLRALEDAIESSTDALMLPTSQPGTLTFRNCTEPCKLRTLEVTAQSAFFVGATQVTLAQFNDFLRRLGGPEFLMVFRQPGQNSVTRLTVAGRYQPQ